MKAHILVWAAIVVLFTVTNVSAATIVTTLPEFNGQGIWPATEFAGTFSYTIPTGEQVMSATISGTFGNSTIPNTAVMDVLVDGLTVTSCPDQSQPCWTAQAPTPWIYSFLPSQFWALADGMADLTVNQTDCCVIRLGQTTLTIQTSGIPEPSTYVLFGAGLAALGFLRRRVRS